MRNDYVYLALAALVGCAPPLDRRAAANLRPAPRAHVAAPAYASLTATRVVVVDPREGEARAPPARSPVTPGAARTEATLVARVTLDAYADVPVTVTLSLPPGASIREGRARFTLAAVRPESVVEERYVIAPPPLRLHRRGALGLRSQRPDAAGRGSGAPLTLGRHRFGPRCAYSLSPRAARSARTVSVASTETIKSYCPPSVRGYRVRVLDGFDLGLQAASVGGRLTVGTGEGATLRLTDPTVSRFHAEFEAVNGAVVLRDLGSSNGTRVGAAGVREVVLHRDVEVLVGRTRLGLTLTGDAVTVEVTASSRFGRLRGASAAMRSVFAALTRAAPTTAPVLLTGESGTGKELAARALHDASPRAPMPFEVVDCGGLAPRRSSRTSSSATSAGPSPAPTATRARPHRGGRRRHAVPRRDRRAAPRRPGQAPAAGAGGGVPEGRRARAPGRRRPARGRDAPRPRGRRPGRPLLAADLYSPAARGPDRRPAAAHPRRGRPPTGSSTTSTTGRATIGTLRRRRRDRRRPT